MHAIGFDREKYLALQSHHIDARRRQFGGKLYLELGGKLFDDLHASRVLPGFTPDTKIAMLEQLKDDLEIVVVVSAKDLARNKVRADHGISYDEDVLRLVDGFRSRGLYVGSVVISRVTEDNGHARAFKRKLEKLGLKVYRHYPIRGYPNDIPLIVSEHGYGRNDYVETSRDVVVLTGPGPGSGKMATCLSQLYHDHVRGIPSGYAKFETFPIWNLPLRHPVNVAYEAATVDLGDVNMIDPFHLEAYGVQAVNYNRDIEVFPILRAILERIWGEMPYQSPTDMGVNMVGNSITDLPLVEEAARQEVIRRLYNTLVEQRRGHAEEEEVIKLRMLMQQLNLSDDNRPVIAAARKRADSTGAPAAAAQLPNGDLITGKTSSLLGASSALLLNCLKALANIPRNEKLIPPEVIGPIQDLKLNYLGNSNPRLHTDEVLVALSITAATSEKATLALSQLPQLKGCEVHTSVILSEVDENIFRRLGVNLTCDPVYQSRRLYHKGR